MKQINFLFFMLLSILTFGQIKVINTPKAEEIGKVGNFAATFLTMSKVENEY